MPLHRTTRNAIDLRRWLQLASVNQERIRGLVRVDCIPGARHDCGALARSKPIKEAKLASFSRGFWLRVTDPTTATGRGRRGCCIFRACTKEKTNGTS